MKTKIFLFVFTLFFTFSIHSQYISQYQTGMFSAINFPWLYNGTIYGYYSDLQVNQVIKYSYHFDNDNSQMEGGFYDALTGY